MIVPVITTVTKTFVRYLIEESVSAAVSADTGYIISVYERKEFGMCLGPARFCSGLSTAPPIHVMPKITEEQVAARIGPKVSLGYGNFEMMRRVRCTGQTELCLKSLEQGVTAVANQANKEKIDTFRKN